MAALAAEPTPKFVGAFVLGALVLLLVLHRGLAGISVQVGS